MSLKVEIGNPNVVWSASEDGTLRQHDFREGMSCPPDGASHQECHNVLVSIVFSRVFCVFRSKIKWFGKFLFSLLFFCN